MEGMECVDRENVAPVLGEVLNGGESCIANGRCWEAQEGDASTVSVRGRLGACITYWEEVLYSYLIRRWMPCVEGCRQLGSNQCLGQGL